MARKVRMFIRASEMEREPFVFADADCQFFGPDPAAELLAMSTGFDLSAQNDGGARLCAGLFVGRPNPELAWFFDQVLSCMGSYKDEQDALNARWKECRVKAQQLPSRAFTLAMGMGWKVWRGGNGEIDAASIPSDIVVHHANWMVGVDRKIYAMDRVKWRVERGLYDRLPADIFPSDHNPHA